jgi:uncharacterized Rmd1/YagE family protein
MHTTLATQDRAQHKTQHTTHNTLNAQHQTRDTRHSTKQNTTINTQHIPHRTLNAQHQTPGSRWEDDEDDPDVWKLIDADEGDVFVFSYGVVVCWGLTEEQTQELQTVMRYVCVRVCLVCVCVCVCVCVHTYVCMYVIYISIKSLSHL